MKEVYMIISPDGGVAYNIFTGKGKAYSDKEKAKKVLNDKNDWSRAKGYGTFSLMTFEVEE